MDAIEPQTVSQYRNARHQDCFYWFQLIDHLKAEKLELASCFHNLQASKSFRQDDLDFLRTLSVSASTQFDRGEALEMLGVLAFTQGRYKESLSAFQSVLEKDQSHFSVLPYFIWNCLALGLIRDAAKALQVHEKQQAFFQSSSTLQIALSPSLRWTTLLSYLDALKARHQDWLEKFRFSWDRAKIGSAGFDFDVMDVMRHFVLANDGEGRKAAKDLYRLNPNEWLPAMLMAIMAFGDRDAALCFEMLDIARRKSPQKQHFFVDHMTRGMVRGLQTR